MKFYVANLAADITDAYLKKIFEKVGKVSDAYIVSDITTNTPTRFGIVSMASPVDANLAYEVINGMMFGGFQIKIFKIFDMQQIDERRVLLDRRVTVDRRLGCERWRKERRNKFKQEKLGNIFAELDKRVTKERRWGKERKVAGMMRCRDNKRISSEIRRMNYKKNSPNFKYNSEFIWD